MDDEKYVINPTMSGIVEEAYKVLRTNIQFCELGKPIKVITITSYGPGEGKSTVSMNLAMSMARSGMKVLLVDADLRKPMILKELGTRDFKGVSNYIMGHISMEEVVNSTSIQGFYFTACGVKPLNPAELVGTEKFSEFLSNARDKFDTVIIDTPPLGSVIDAAIIAAKSDGTIIVIEQGAVKYRNAKMVKEQLNKANTRILGVVLNKVDKLDYKSYYNGYDYYGSSKKYVKGWIKKIKKAKRIRGHGHD